jgi:transcriptional regulator with XRE-family HTH domain
VVEVNLGGTVRRLREEQGLSLRTLATRTGFSASFLSQVENGQASPSISSMERIGAALGVTLGQFFQGAESASAIVKANTRVQLTSGWSKSRLESLGGDSGAGRAEAVLVTIETGGMSGTRPHPAPREEFAMVLQGRVLLILGEVEHILEYGDAVTIHMGTLRRWYNQDGAPARILLVSLR